MKETKSALNIHQRKLAIMGELDYIQKGPKTVNGQYRFTSHDQVTGAIHPLLVKHGVDINSSIEEMTQDGNRTTVKLKVVLTNADSPEDSFFCYWYGQGIDTSDKGIGKAISYAYKYALLKTFNLETGDDPDNEVNVTYEPKKCLEFDAAIPDKVNEENLEKFLKQCAESSGKHVEDVKREAVKKMPEFIKAFNKWEAKQ